MSVRLSRVIISACLAGGLAFASEAVLVTPPTSAARAGGGSGLYLALGDSLAAGCTASPSSSATFCPAQGTIAGYVADLVGSIKSPRLTTVDLGCSGETTTSMIAGGRCRYVLGGSTYSSQLAEAQAWLGRARRARRPALVTIDLGANDLRACAPSSLSLTISPACLTAATDTASRNLATILTALKGADPRARIVGMTYYDPALAAWLTGLRGRLLAIGSTIYAAAFNQALQAVYSHFGARVANVQGAFRTFDVSQHKSLPPSVPVDVYDICALTYTCASLGTNPHPNRAGYQLIADAFLRAGA